MKVREKNTLLSLIISQNMEMGYDVCVSNSKYLRFFQNSCIFVITCMHNLYQDFVGGMKGVPRGGQFPSAT